MDTCFVFLFCQEYKMHIVADQGFESVHKLHKHNKLSAHTVRQWYVSPPFLYVWKQRKINTKHTQYW